MTTPAPQKAGLIDQLKQVIGAGLTAVEEYQKQWAATIKAEASGWTKGLMKAQFLSKGAGALGLAMEIPAYGQILNSGSSQMGVALTVHTGAIVAKGVITGFGALVGGGIGSIFPGVGTTYGATIGAAGSGYFGSMYIDKWESSYLNSVGVKQ